MAHDVKTLISHYFFFFFTRASNAASATSPSEEIYRMPAEQLHDLARTRSFLDMLEAIKKESLEEYFQQRGINRRDRIKNIRRAAYEKVPYMPLMSSVINRSVLLLGIFPCWYACGWSWRCFASFPSFSLFLLLSFEFVFSLLWSCCIFLL